MMSSPAKLLAPAALLLASAHGADATSPATVEALIAGIRDKDDQVRGHAWHHAASCGPEAIRPLAELFTDPEAEVARAAKRAIWQIVRHVGRPGAAGERSQTVTHLLHLLATGVPALRREVLWMLSEIAGHEAVAPMAALLSDPALREDARMTLQRISGREVVAVLKKALSTAPEEFKPNLAHSLRALGEKVEGWPSQNLVPSKPTSVKAPGAP